MKCPNCKEGKLVLKDEVTYVYLYDIADDGKVKWQDDDGYASYVFYDREQKDFRQYVQCSQCKEIFDHLVSRENDMDMVIVKKAIHSNHTISNEFFK